MEKTVLVVDDEEAVVEFVEINLRRAGFNVLKGFCGADAVRMALEQSPDLMVLDIAMPDMTGFEVCRRVRRDSGLPIILLSSNAEAEAKVAGLELGADDYVVKPFNPEELVRRIRAVLRRSRASLVNPSVKIRLGDIVIDAAGNKAFRDGKAISLTRRECELLLFMSRSPDKPFSRTELLTEIWGGDAVEERTVDLYVRRLREKLQDDPIDPRYIVTVRGKGYMANSRPFDEEDTI